MKGDRSILSLIRYNLIKCYNKKLITCSLVVTLITCVMYMGKVTEYYRITGNTVNQWDYFFRIFSNPFILEFMFIPILLFITAPVSTVNNRNKYVYIRTSKKYKIVIAEQLSNLIIITTYILLIGILIFCLGGYYSRFDSNWSNAIVGEKKIQVATEYLFFNNFIYSYSPMAAAIISIFKFIATTHLVILLRDFIIYMFKKNIISILVAFSYLLINYRDPVTLGKLSIGELGTIWCHEFEANKHLSLSMLDSRSYSTVNVSNIVLICSIIIMLIFALLAFRRKESEKI